MEYKTRRFLRAIEDRYQKSLLRSSSELQEVRFAAALASEIRRSGHADRGEAVGGAPEKFGRSVQNVSDSRPSCLQEARAVTLATVLLCPQTDSSL